MGLTSHDSLEVSTCFNLPVGIPNSSGKSEHGLCLDVPCGLPFYSFYLSHQNSDQRINMNQQTSLAMPACLDVYVTHLRVFFPIVLAPYPNLWGLLGLKFPNKSTQLHPHGRNHQESWSNSIRKSLSPRPRVCFVPMVGPAHTWPWGCTSPTSPTSPQQSRCFSPQSILSNDAEDFASESSVPTIIRFTINNAMAW